MLVFFSTDIFLSHNWGENNEIHEKVKAISEKLTDIGYSTWFDEKDLFGDISTGILKAIDRTGCVVIFITKE